MQAISIQVSLESEGIRIRILNIRDADARYCRDMDDKQQVKHEQLIGARNCNGNACLLICGHVTFTDAALKNIDNLNLDNPWIWTISSIKWFVFMRQRRANVHSESHSKVFVKKCVGKEDCRRRGRADTAMNSKGEYEWGLRIQYVSNHSRE